MGKISKRSIRSHSGLRKLLRGKIIPPGETFSSKRLIVREGESGAMEKEREREGKGESRRHESPSEERIKDRQLTRVCRWKRRLAGEEIIGHAADKIEPLFPRFFHTRPRRWSSIRDRAPILDRFRTTLDEFSMNTSKSLENVKKRNANFTRRREHVNT